MVSAKSNNKRNKKITNWNNEMQKRWNNLCPPLRDYLCFKSKVRKKLRWSSSIEGKFKLNFDSATKGNLGMVGVRCIVMDSKGECIWALSNKIEAATNNEAKMEALARGLWLFLHNGIRSIEIEGDSQLCIKVVCKMQFKIRN